MRAEGISPTVPWAGVDVQNASGRPPFFLILNLSGLLNVEEGERDMAGGGALGTKGDILKCSWIFGCHLGRSGSRGWLSQSRDWMEK